MPHTIVEYSANVAKHHDIDALVDALHAAVTDLDLATIGALRTRAAERDVYRIADGDPDHAFVAITVRLGPGRSDEIKHHVMETLLDTAVAQIEADDGPLHVAWSIEVQEIDAAFRRNRNHVKTHLDGADHD